MALQFWRDPLIFPILVAYIYIMYDVMDTIYDSVTVNKAPMVSIEKRVVGRTPDETPETYTQRHPFEGVYSKHIFDCANIHNIHITKELGRGKSKQAYLGIFENKNYVIKMATEKVSEVAKCASNLKKHKIATHVNLWKCYGFANMKIMLEVLLLHQIQHENLAQLVGYCVRNNELKNLDLRHHGVISVFEYGKHISTDDIRAMPWKTRLRHAYELSSLLRYFDHSPLGSLFFPAIKLSHFVLADDRMKMIDLDGIVSVDPTCKDKTECDLDTTCQNGVCTRYNSKRNLEQMRDELIIPLLTGVDFPTEVLAEIEDIKLLLATLSIDAETLEAKLVNIAQH